MAHDIYAIALLYLSQHPTIKIYKLGAIILVLNHPTSIYT